MMIGIESMSLHTSDDESANVSDRMFGVRQGKPPMPPGQTLLLFKAHQQASPPRITQGQAMPIAKTLRQAPSPAKSQGQNPTPEKAPTTVGLLASLLASPPVCPAPPPVKALRQARAPAPCKDKPQSAPAIIVVVPTTSICALSVHNLCPRIAV